MPNASHTPISSTTPKNIISIGVDRDTIYRYTLERDTGGTSVPRGLNRDIRRSLGWNEKETAGKIPEFYDERIKRLYKDLDQAKWTTGTRLRHWEDIGSLRRSWEKNSLRDEMESLMQQYKGIWAIPSIERGRPDSSLIAAKENGVYPQDLYSDRTEHYEYIKLQLEHLIYVKVLQRRENQIHMEQRNKSPRTQKPIKRKVSMANIVREAETNTGTSPSSEAATLRRSIRKSRSTKRWDFSLRSPSAKRRKGGDGDMATDGIPYTIGPFRCRECISHKRGCDTEATGCRECRKRGVVCKYDDTLPISDGSGAKPAEPNRPPMRDQASSGPSAPPVDSIMRDDAESYDDSIGGIYVGYPRRDDREFEGGAGEEREEDGEPDEGDQAEHQEDEAREEEDNDNEIPDRSHEAMVAGEALRVFLTTSNETSSGSSEEERSGENDSRQESATAQSTIPCSPSGPSGDAAQGGDGSDRDSVVITHATVRLEELKDELQVLLWDELLASVNHNDEDLLSPEDVLSSEASNARKAKANALWEQTVAVDALIEKILKMDQERLRKDAGGDFEMRERAFLAWKNRRDVTRHLGQAAHLHPFQVRTPLKFGFEQGQKLLGGDIEGIRAYVTLQKKLKAFTVDWKNLITHLPLLLASVSGLEVAAMQELVERSYSKFVPCAEM